jgi:hypothetical protein
VLRVVPVRVDSVAVRDDPVPVVVAEVLPPEPLDVEGVLVSVRVVNEDEPQLGVLQQPLNRLVVGPPLVDVPVEQAPIDLCRDPFTRV